MDEHTGTDSIKFGDQSTSDITIRLKNSKGRQELVHSHSSVLKSKSTYFADRLSDPTLNTFLEIECTDFNYDHHLKLVKCLYLPEGSLLVEEDEIVIVVSKLGPIGMPVLERIQPADFVATKNVFISAIRFATSIDGPCPPFGDELRISAQEQVKYMLGDDEDMPLVAADNDVKLETKTGLSKTFSLFERELYSILEPSDVLEVVEDRIMRCLSDIEWMCGILLKMGLTSDFVSKWIDVSESVLRVVEDERLGCIVWGLKVRLIHVASKVLDAVGYGNVILPAPSRVRLLKSWLPFIRKLKPLLDSMRDGYRGFIYKMDEVLWQSIEGAIVSLVSALPSDDQADIFANWMNGDQRRYPDLSEAFEVWCFRTKSARRRLVRGLDRVDTTVSH